MLVSNIAFLFYFFVTKRLIFTNLYQFHSLKVIVKPFKLNNNDLI